MLSDSKPSAKDWIEVAKRKFGVTDVARLVVLVGQSTDFAGAGNVSGMIDLGSVSSTETGNPGDYQVPAGKTLRLLSFENNDDDPVFGYHDASIGTLQTGAALVNPKWFGGGTVILELGGAFGGQLNCVVPAGKFVFFKNRANSSPTADVAVYGLLEDI